MSRRHYLPGVAGLIAAGLAFAAVVRFSAEDPRVTPPPGLPAAEGVDGTRSGKFMHDFGLVRAGGRVEHWFAVPNGTDRTWTVADLGSSCHCTVGRVAEEVVPPGGMLQALVRYRAGHDSVDDRKSVTVRLREADAPTIRLTVRARVRPPMTLFPAEVAVPDLGLDTRAEHDLIVANYTSVDWPRLAAETGESWLTATVVPLEGSVAPPVDARQAWRVLVGTDATGLDYGDHAGMVRLAGGGETAALPVRVTVRRPVTAIPAALFLPEVPAGATVEKGVLLRFGGAGAPAYDPEKVLVTHDLGSQVETTVREVGPRTWQLLVRLTPALTPADDSSRFLSGTLTVSFAGTTLPATRIGLRASVLNDSPDPEPEVE